MDIFQKCKEALDRTVRFYRLGMEAQGSEDFVAFIDALMEILPVLPPDSIQQTNALLQEIVHSQADKDYLRVADLLAYGEILPPIMEHGRGG